MSSAIFYRFRSQKQTSRIFFDGTGITVFDLKKEIIAENKLGDGTNFELRIYNNDTNEEYSDDTLVIPRSSSIIARRSPPSKHSKGNATRYVTGKPRITKVTLQDTHKKEQESSALSSSSAAAAAAQAGSDTKLTEEERISQMFANQGDQWNKTQQQMSSATPVYNKPSTTTNSTAGTNDVPPPGYICYRCGSKDHWIKNCPTNNDPNWEGKRIKRTTGIPKTYLQTIENPQDDSTKSLMMDADGKFVVQVADAKAWESYTKKLNKTNELINDLKDIDVELLDPINGKLMQDPVTTPCCSKNYSKKSIEDSLLDSDFICPNCHKEDIFLDHLIPNDEIKDKIDKLLDEEFAKRGIKRNNEELIDGDSTNENEFKRQNINGSSTQNFNQLPIMPVPPFLPFPPFGMMPGVVPPIIPQIHPTSNSNTGNNINNHNNSTNIKEQNQ
ncbi:hypothetical protein WICMUC_005517 [Wickerhamomyces mucosus]|uniref:DWNN domain-containing protein n=1 Tax=Wickerhamomyces mucosus TaxID=1378264 RepID=A0A9P8P802_9ASCO|nr:hypothetical protein WICMUC_005517 [Wickerhamomyces mucosus]